MSSETISIRSHHGSKSAVEKAAQVIFMACGFFAVLAVDVYKRQGGRRGH